MKTDKLKAKLGRNTDLYGQGGENTGQVKLTINQKRQTKTRGGHQMYKTGGEKLQSKTGNH